MPKCVVVLLTIAALVLAGCGKPAPEAGDEPGASTPVPAVPESGETIHIETPEGTADISEGHARIETDEGTTTIEGTEEKVTVTTPEGTVVSGAKAVSEEDVGLKFYPGAVLQHGSRIDNKDGTRTVSAILTTADSVQAVYDFYVRELGEPLAQKTIIETGDGKMAAINKEGEPRFAVTAMPGDGQTQIMLSRIEKAE